MRFLGVFYRFSGHTPPMETRWHTNGPLGKLCGRAVVRRGQHDLPDAPVAQPMVICHIAREVMLDVINAHPERLVADEKRAADRFWPLEEHGHLGPEKTIEQMIRAVRER